MLVITRYDDQKTRNTRDARRSLRIEVPPSAMPADGSPLMFHVVLCEIKGDRAKIGVEAAREVSVTRSDAVFDQPKDVLTPPKRSGPKPRRELSGFIKPRQG